MAKKRHRPIKNGEIMKKIISLLLVLALSVSAMLLLGSCGNDGGENSGEQGDGTGNNGNGEGQGGGETKPTVYTYKVTVLAGDEGVEGAMIVFKSGSKSYQPVTTDEYGEATLETEDNVEMSASLVTLPSAYSSYFTSKPATTLYTLTNRELTLTVAEELVLETYTIYLVDADGNPVAGQLVQMCDKVSGVCLNPVTTDENGVAVYNEPAGNRQWQAQVSGNTSNPKVDFNSDREATLVYPAQ